jgi:tripeptidyl-peptidase I
MRILSFFFFQIYLCQSSTGEICATLSPPTHIFKESVHDSAPREDFISRTSLQPGHIHELVFVVRQQNMDKLTDILHDVSNPASPNYGQHMSVEQVYAMTFNPVARDAIVNYLHSNGASVTSEILSGDLITATAPLSVWETVLDTEFYTFNQMQPEGEIRQRVGAEMYSIPTELDPHLESVLNVIEMPYHISLPTRSRSRSYSLPGDRRSKDGFKMQESDPPGYLRPQEIRTFYNLSNVYGSAESTQAAVAFGKNYFSPKSLANFQRYVSFQKLQPALLFGGFVSDNPLDDSGEGNLDVQYLIGISPGSPTTFWYNNGGYGSFLNEVLNTPNPPLVLSLSYGLQESQTSAGTHRYVTTSAKKLGIIGVTLLVASGDDGAVGTDARSSPPKCDYQPYFPAGNPYFTAVGATMVRQGDQIIIFQIVCIALNSV